MNKQEVVGLLDRSGSMRGKEQDTIGGINKMFENIKNEIKENDNVKISLKLFDHEESLIWRSINIKDIRELTEKDFIPRGQTALFDALGNTLSYFMEKKLMDPDAYTSCLIYIATDGLENASKFYNKTALKKLILKAKENYNIDIVYLAANQDAILEAGNIGIPQTQAINYNESRNETEAVYAAVSRVVSSQRTGNNIDFLQAERQASQVTSNNNGSPQMPPLTRQVPLSN
tara:strand:- start:112 stop:804 length:693 start_codon:yes stop_codon:yes gene_type:complete